MSATTTTNHLLAQRTREAFDPGLHPTTSDYLQDLLDSPTDLRDVLVGHIEHERNAPHSVIGEITAVIDEFIDTAGKHAVTQVTADGWRHFIGTGTDAYHRALGCQILHSLLDLLGTPSPVMAPLPTQHATTGNIVDDNVFPPTGDISIGRGGKPTRIATDLEIATLRYAVLPQLKQTETNRSGHRRQRREQYAAAATTGCVTAMATSIEIAGLCIDQLDFDLNNRLTIATTTTPVTLDDWATAQTIALIKYDRYEGNDVSRPLLYGGRHDRGTISATNTINNIVIHALNRCGLDRGGLTNSSLRLWGARNAINDDADIADIARRLGIGQGTRRNTETLTAILNKHD